jgi:hypothetical protein
MILFQDRGLKFDILNEGDPNQRRIKSVSCDITFLSSVYIVGVTMQRSNLPSFAFEMTRWKSAALTYGDVDIPKNRFRDAKCVYR